jgi:hypothetical protein
MERNSLLRLRRRKKMNNQELILQLAELAKRHHYYCEDGFYSCPLAEDGCYNEQYPKDKCNCGAEDHNKKVEEILKQIAPPNLTSGCNLTEPRKQIACYAHLPNTLCGATGNKTRCGNTPCIIDMENSVIKF